MKNNIILCFVWVVVICTDIKLYSQTDKHSFQLRGEVLGLDTGIIYLSYYNTAIAASIQDSCFISKGQFDFHGALKEPSVAFITMEKNLAFGDNVTNIFIEPSRMEILLELNKFSEAKLTGSSTQKDYENLLTLGQHLREKYQRGSEQLSNEKFAGNRDSLTIMLARCIDSLNFLDYQFFFEHPQSIVTAYRLQFHSRTLSSDSLALFYNRFDKQLKRHPIGQTIRSRIKPIKAGLTGSIAPKFIAKDMNGNEFYSGFIKDKYILLDFWATWCIPCRQNSQHLVALHKKYQAKGLRIIGIADDRDETKWKEAIEKDGTKSWVHVLRGVNPDFKLKGLKDMNDVNEKFNISALPTYIVIDPYGVIVGRIEAKNNPMENLEKIFESIFPDTNK